MPAMQIARGDGACDVRDNGTWGHAPCLMQRRMAPTGGERLYRNSGGAR